MISPRTVGIFMIACAAICLTIAIERYYSAVATAKAIAERLEGIEFASVEPPRVSYVCGFTGVILLVAGLRLLFESRHHSKSEEGLLTE